MSICSCSNQREHYSMERRPKMLKDFLIDDSNSYSSSGFKSYPRRMVQEHHHQRRLRRSRSKAASVTISAFQALVNSVKSIQFTAVKSSSIILPRSLSRGLSKKNINRAQSYNTSTSSTTSHEGNKMITTVKIKDIIRWKSFRDLLDEESQSQPSEHHHHHHHHGLISSPDHHTTTSCSSTASSWCDSDFTSEYYLPSCGGNYEECSENDVELGKKYLPCVGRDSLEATTESPTVGPKDDLAYDQKEQRNPISVFDDRFEENLLSFFDRILNNVKGTKQKLVQNFRRLESLAKIDSINLDEWMSMTDNDGYGGDDSDYDEEKGEEEEDEVEEKAKLLMNHVKATSFMKNSEDTILEQTLLDFFVEELSTKRNRIRNVEADIDQMIRLAKSWINGEQRGAMELEKCVREMDRKDRWSKFEEEQEDIGLQIEDGLLNHLLDELLPDILLC